MAESTRKPRGPNRPPLAAPQIEVGAKVPDPASRRSAWAEHAKLAADNAPAWVRIGPFYRDTASGARKRLRDNPPVEGLEVEVRHIDAETSNVFLRVVPTEGEEVDAA